MCHNCSEPHWRESIEVKNGLGDLRLFQSSVVEHFCWEGVGVSKGRGRAALAVVDVSPKREMGDGHI